MSKPSRKSSPSPKWKASSFSSSYRSPHPVRSSTNRMNLKGGGPYNLPYECLDAKQFSINSERLDYFPAKRRSSVHSRSPMTSRTDSHHSSSSRNQIAFETGSYSRFPHKPFLSSSRSNTVKHYSPQTKVVNTLRNERRDNLHTSDLKYSHGVSCDFYPATKRIRALEDRSDTHNHHLRSPRSSSADTTWRSPPCRQESRSTVGKLPLNYQDYRLHNYRRPYSYRNFSSHCLKTAVNLKGSDRFLSHERQTSSHSCTERPSIVEKQFNDDKLNTGEKGCAHSRKLQSPPKLLRKTKKSSVGENNKHSFEQQRASNCLDGENIQHSRYDLKSPEIHHKQAVTARVSVKKKNVQSAHNYRHQQDSDHYEIHHQNYSSDENSSGRVKVSAENISHRLDEKGAAGCDKLRESDDENGTSSVDSFRDQSWPKLATHEKSSSRSLTSSRTGSITEDGAMHSEESRVGARKSMTSTHSISDVHVKTQNPEFNPDFVVIIRRSTEGSRPLCMREEFLSTDDHLANDNKEKKVNLTKVSNSLENSSALQTTLVDLNQKTNVTLNALPSPNAKNSMTKSSGENKKRIEKINERFAVAETAKSSHVTPNLSVENLHLSTERQESPARRFVSVGRTRCESAATERDVDCRHINVASKPVEKAALSRNTYDLRQKIAERRRMRLGKTAPYRCVRHFPSRWRQLPYSSTKSRQYRVGMQYAAEGKRFSVSQSTESRRSVILKHSLKALD